MYRTLTNCHDENCVYATPNKNMYPLKWHIGTKCLDTATKITFDESDACAVWIMVTYLRCQSMRLKSSNIEPIIHKQRKSESDSKRKKDWIWPRRKFESAYIFSKQWLFSSQIDVYFRFTSLKTHWIVESFTRNFTGRYSLIPSRHHRWIIIARVAFSLFLLISFLSGKNEAHNFMCILAKRNHFR